MAAGQGRRRDLWTVAVSAFIRISFFSHLRTSFSYDCFCLRTSFSSFIDANEHQQIGYSKREIKIFLLMFFFFSMRGYVSLVLLASAVASWA